MARRYTGRRCTYLLTHPSEKIKNKRKEDWLCSDRWGGAKGQTKKKVPGARIELATFGL